MIDEMADSQSDDSQESISETDETEQLETGEEETDATPEKDEAKKDESEQEQDEIIVTIGDEDAPSSEEPAPAWVKELRKTHRDTIKENRELRQQLDAIKQPKLAPQLGKKPTLDDFDYDADRYETALTEWFDKKKEVEYHQHQAKQHQDQQQQEWQNKLADYESKKKSLKFNDIDDAESIVQSFLNVTQQGLIVQGAENPALVVYALGKNPKKTQELASIKDPIKFAFQVAKLESKLNIKNRKAVTKPESKVSGSGAISGTVDSTLERLRADAEKTGDYSKVTAHRRSQRKAQ